MPDTYLIRIDGPIVPKARPRGTAAGTFYMPANYAACKSRLVRSFKSEKRELQIPDIDYQVRIYVVLIGKHNRSGDMVDNIPGTICDAAVKAKLIPDDSSMWAPGAIYEMNWSKAPPIGFLAIAPFLPLRNSHEQTDQILDAIDSLRK